MGSNSSIRLAVRSQSREPGRFAYFSFPKKWVGDCISGNSSKHSDRLASAFQHRSPEVAFGLNLSPALDYQV
jgi:hypothetical protein